jgi:N-methylhydantoinase B
VNERLANAVACCFAQIGEPYGMAEGGGNASAALGVVSGVDKRRKSEVEYVTQLMLGLSGGPGTYGHDGWLTYECAVGNGIMVNDSIEVDEATYPILIEERSVATDSMGFGHWNGAPAVKGSYRSLTGDMTVYFFGDGGTFPAKGVLGGKAGAGCGTWKRHKNGKLERQPDFDHCTAGEKEAVHYRSSAGGGYGDPRRREPARVLADVNRRWLSVEAARKAFGVAVKSAPNGVDYVLDEAGTARLRAKDGTAKSVKRKAGKPTRKAASRSTKRSTKKTGR